MKKIFSLAISFIMAFTIMPIMAFAGIGQMENAEVNNDISSDMFQVELSRDTYAYNGDYRYPEVYVTNLETMEELWEDEDYYVEYKYNKNPGTAIVKVEGLGDYTGRVILDFTITKGKTKISLKNKTKTYNGSRIGISAAKVSGYSRTITYTYYKNSKCTKKTTVKSNGAKAKGKAPKYAGTYYVRAKVKANDYYTAGTSNVAKLIIKKAPQKITKGKYKKTYKKATLQKGSQSFKIGAKSTKGKLTYKKKSGSSRIKISSKGKVRILKGTKAGTYTARVKITAKATRNYKKKTITKKIIIKVKKPVVKKKTSSTYVYITATGIRYHCRTNCPGLRNARAVWKVTLSEARSQGLTPCHVCY